MKINLFVSAVIILSLTLSMTFGSMLADSGSKEEAGDAEEASSPELPSVRYRDSTAADHIQTISLRCKTIPACSAVLRAEIGGAIEKGEAERGA